MVNAAKSKPVWGASADQVRNGTSVLKHNQTGSGVEHLQRQLAEAGYAVNKSGKYDDETLLAVRKFQDDYGLRGNGGMVDQGTLKTLEGAGRRDERMAAIVKDKEISPQEARQAVALAAADAKLKPGDRDPKNVTPALISLYTRQGMPVGEAETQAKKTLELASKGSGDPLKLKFDKPPKLDVEAVRAKSESDTAQNSAKDKAWAMKDIKADREGFVRNMVQTDGDPKTATDRSSCAVQSMLAGSILERPESAKELGDKLLSEKGKKEFPEFQKEPLRSSAERMRSGKFSPADVSRVGTGLHDSVQYRDPDPEAKGKQTGGLTLGRDLALQGKLQNIGWKPEASRIDSYATPDRRGTHATAYANGTGYDPFPYPGAGGQSTVTRGEESARRHGETMGPRYGNHDQRRALYERTELDGKGGVTFTQNYADGKKLEPPLKARYTFDPASQEWTRDPGVKVSSDLEKYLPPRIPVDLAKLERLPIDH